MEVMLDAVTQDAAVMVVLEFRCGCHLGVCWLDDRLAWALDDREWSLGAHLELADGVPWPDPGYRVGIVLATT